MPRIFLSSTASDLDQYRPQVAQTIEQLRLLPIAMETFTAAPGTPVEECKRLAAAADALIVIVAHRYGFVPNVAAGGDGEKSITWLEVLSAMSVRKPVFAFLVDPEAPWPHLKESDAINTANSHEFAGIIEAVKGLRSFKDYLAATVLYETFSTQDDLARKVATALANYFASDRASQPPSRAIWAPRVCHALQPARHFAGRGSLLGDLNAWAVSLEPEQRVVALVAAGGTGKTAIVHRVLVETERRLGSGCFVWSFYEEPKVEKFIAAAAAYFDDASDGIHGEPTADRLRHALSSPNQHLLILDGIELLQAEGTGANPKWSIENRELRQLLQWLTSGGGRFARALLTSRFPLVDLHEWLGGGYAEKRLEDLEPQAAVDLLRRLGVSGDDALLGGLAREYGYHALTLAVLGSYLSKYWSGDSSNAPSIDYAELGSEDVKSSRLKRVLEYYAERLSATERLALTNLAALAEWQAGVTLDQLYVFVNATTLQNQLGGARHKSELRGALLELVQAGLVFAHEAPHSKRYSAHPFVTAVFRGQLGRGGPPRLNERGMRLGSPSLEGRPARLSGDYEDLTDELTEFIFANLCTSMHA